MSVIVIALLCAVSAAAGVVGGIALMHGSVKTLEDQLLSRAGVIRAAVEARENFVRGKIKTDVAVVVGDIKKWHADVKQEADAIIAQFEARLKQIL